MVLQLDLSDNQLCGKDRWGRGTHTAEGITAIADALRVNGGLTRVDVRHNYSVDGRHLNLVGNSAKQLSVAVLGNLKILSAAVLGNLKIEMFNGIPIKEMRANSFTELDLMGHGVRGVRTRQ